MTGGQEAGGGFRAGLPVIDTHIGFRESGKNEYDFITRQTKDRESKEKFAFPAEYMLEAMGYTHSKTDPVEVTLRFIVPRPKNAKRRLWPFTRGSGDVDKLSRNVLDAISDTRKAPGVLRDDSCVVMLHASKHYQSAKDPHIGVSIIIQNARDEDA